MTPDRTRSVLTAFGQHFDAVRNFARHRCPRGADEVAHDTFATLLASDGPLTPAVLFATAAEIIDERGDCCCA